MDPVDRAVALVYPFFRRGEDGEQLFPPLGIACLASQLKKRGIPVAIVDCTFDTREEAINRIIQCRPAIVGISVMVTLSRNAFSLLETLRIHLPETLFIAGGPLPTIYPARFASLFDAVFRGESDDTFPRFCKDYITRGMTRDALDSVDHEKYPGIYLKRGSTVYSSPQIHHPADILDSFPLPDRSGFDHRKYQETAEKNTGFRQTTLMVTRGCPHSCDFCSRPVWGSIFRKPQLDRVFREIDGIRALGYTSIWIADDCFTLDHAFLTAFCREMIHREVPVQWTCLSRVDKLTPEVVRLMKDAGCIRVYLGLESGSDETLALMNKHVSVNQGIRAVRLFSWAGIGTAGFFMVGYPRETVESIEKTFALALSLPLDEAWFTVPLPLPGTPLFDRVAHPDSWEDWEIPNQVKFVYPSEFDENWLGRRIRETMKTFRDHKRKKNQTQ